MIEFISYFFRSLSLSIRLFANIFAGHILLHVVAGFIQALILSPLEGFSASSFFSILTVVILCVLLFFEFMVACLQCYIFLVLSLIYLKDINNLSH
jgi:F0F1-type ATP synthase membrane subunit a